MSAHDPVRASVMTDTVALWAVGAVLVALAVAIVAHHLMERRRIKQSELQDLQRRTASAIQSHE